MKLLNCAEFGVRPIPIEGADLEEGQSIEECADEEEQDLLQSLPISEEWTDMEESDAASVYRLPNHVRCAAHTLSLVATTDAKEALKPGSNFNSIHHSTMGKAQALWNKSGRPKSAEIIKEALGCSLRLPCVTRWNSLYDAVLLLVKHKEKLNSVCQQLSIPVFRQTEVEFLCEFAEAVKPVACALDRLQGDKNSFYGELTPALLNVESKLLSLQSTGGLKYCTPLVDALLRGLTKRFGSFLQLNTQDPQVVHAIIASTSHPYFKLRWLELKPALCAKEDDIKRFVIAAMEAGQDPSSSENSASSDPDDFYQFSKRRKTRTSSEMTLLSFLQDPDSHLGNLKHHRAVKNVFLKYNTTLPSSAPVERLFSLGGLTLAPRRASLSDTMFERLILLKSNNCCE